MNSFVTIFADFNNTDLEGRVRLTTAGALHDIKSKNISLFKGLEVVLDDRQEFKVRGLIEFSELENIWVARVDWEEGEQINRV